MFASLRMSRPPSQISRVAHTTLAPMGESDYEEADDFDEEGFAALAEEDEPLGRRHVVHTQTDGPSHNKSQFFTN